ncbi:MAG: peptidoglycan bridge formation glycyltransferase FemA/FemB family protein [Nanoarchaeota archaeon]|nr:peptidoglycan bridge formation glycyltransferase FemA/FemB family protein [Nanoarchaeota archaeon]
MTWKGFKDIRATIEIDLKKNEEELWNSLDKDAKWGVNKAKKSKLKVKSCNDKKIWREFHKIYTKTCQYGKIVPLSLEKIKQGKLFGCFFEEKLIAGSVIKTKKRRVILFLNASNHEYLKYQPNNLLYWNLIRWSKKKDFKIFDLGGYQLNAKKGDKLYEINRFKLRWGGEIKKYPLYSKNPLYILGRKIIRNFSFIKNARDNIKISMNKKKFKD